MSAEITDEVRALIDAQACAFEQWKRDIFEELRATLGESNRLQAESEVRCKAFDERTAKREADYDGRNDRAEKRAERQTVAWERIADALTALRMSP